MQSVAVENHMSVLPTGRVLYEKGWELKDIRILTSGSQVVFKRPGS